MEIRLLWVAVVCLAVVGNASEVTKLDFQVPAQCPYIQRQVFNGYVPAKMTDAGTFEEKNQLKTLEECVEACCLSQECNIIFRFTVERNVTCYHISCDSNAACSPVAGKLKPGGVSELVLVRPVSSDLESVQGWQQRPSPNAKLDDELHADDYDNQPAGVGAIGGQSCEFGVGNDCSVTEACVPVNKHSRSGMCQCLPDLTRNEFGDCVRSVEAIVPLSAQLSDEETKIYSESGITGTKGTPNGAVPAKSRRPHQRLTVSVVNKELQLPENKVSLSAYAVPSEKDGEHYTYEWTLLSKPSGEDNSGVMSDQNQATVKLSHLTEGLYTFKVSVSSPQAYGETKANVTVLPEKRFNKPPVVIITPKSQVVKSPNRNAVLDGSDSKDDDRIVKWHWEVQQGPLGYKPHLNDSPTLQLDDLVLPGNYTFRLTVTDSDGTTSSTTANITVQAVKDYPPEANAGKNIVVHLPVRNLTLNGNLSSDDHGIVSWEWTKSPSDQDKKAVDMQDTRTPYLHLSDMEEGMYTFVLKVTDSAGQTGQAEVHVLVKPPVNKPPVVNAGPNVTMSLPRSWVFLDGSKSASDSKIASWKWEQVSGPSGTVITNATSPTTNVTSLSIGNYEFRLTATDDNENSGKSSVFVTVLQNENSPPKANAGGDKTVVLPVSLVTLNGSLSTDDLGINKWQWIREPNSLAIGSVVENSDTTPVLMLTDVIPGRYVFRLKVTDLQGASSEDSVSVIVKPDPHRFDLVELALNIEGEQLMASQAEKVERKLSLLLKDDVVIQVRELRQEDYSGRAIMVFYVEDKSHKSVLPGVTVVRRLKQKLAQDSGLLELSVASIQTQICQNNCSGHGVCDKASRLCMCEAFWMENLIRKHFGDGESNCDWSILYVIIGLFVSLLIWVGGVWGLLCLCQKLCSPTTRPRRRYTTINVAEKDSLIPPYNKEKQCSESDSDSDVVFDSKRPKLNGGLHNGFHDGKSFKFNFSSGRRIKM